MPTDTDARIETVALLDTSTAIALIVDDREAHAAVLEVLREP
jgi:hypothetical protein